eukprot:SAG11_NODE_2281_length_3575_cov_2.137802_4_plen_45_part_00
MARGSSLRGREEAQRIVVNAAAQSSYRREAGGHTVLRQVVRVPK